MINENICFFIYTIRDDNTDNGRSAVVRFGRKRRRNFKREFVTLQYGKIFKRLDFFSFVTFNLSRTRREREKFRTCFDQSNKFPSARRTALIFSNFYILHVCSSARKRDDEIVNFKI